MTSFTIPDGMGEIGGRMFQDCTALTSVTIPGSVKKIGYSAFQNCASLKSIAIPDSVTEIEANVFDGCASLESVSFPAELKRFGKESYLAHGGAFRGCKGLTSIALPACMTRIDSEDFQGCTGLTSLVLPPEVKQIEGSAFAQCENLEWISIPSGVEKIASSAFRGCPAALLAPNTSISVFSTDNKPNAVRGFARLYLQNADMSGAVREGYLKYIKSQRKKLFPLAAAHEEVLQVMLAERMVAQADAPLLLNACKKGRNAAAKAAVAEYVRENFESRAPAEERKKRAPEPAGAPKEKRPKETGKSGPTVAEMKKLWSFKKRADGSLVLTGYKGTDKEVVIPERIGKTPVTALRADVRKSSWERGIFGYGTTAVTIPDSVTSISNYALHGLINVENLRIPPQLTEIGPGAFSGCRLAEARIPQGITEIGKEAFCQCEELKYVELPQSLKRIGEGAFYGCGLTSVVVPAHVEEIEYRTFEECGALCSVVLPEGLRVIGNDAFAGCTALKTVVLPEGLEILENRAFAETGITSLVIPKSVKQMDGDPFFCCENLKDVTILAGMEYLHDGLFVVSGITGKHYDVTIHAPAGSAAEDFAKRNNLKFAAL